MSKFNRDSQANKLKGAIGMHDADVHNIPVNELFHRHTGVVAVLAVDAPAGSTSITVTDDTGLVNGDPVQIDDGVTETTFPIILSGVGTNTLALDRPLDNNFLIGDTVSQITTNLAVDGSGTPVTFVLKANNHEVWHITSFMLTMVHAGIGDDTLFGGLAALTKGCVLRGYNSSTNSYRTFTVWKNNSDIATDMGTVTYNEKAGGGKHGVIGDGRIKSRTGAVPVLDAVAGNYLELVIQDNLTEAGSWIKLKGQGHLEDA